MRLFLDTNVLIDYLAGREPFSQLAQRLLIMRMFGDAELWVSAQSFADAFYVVGKYVDKQDLQRAFAKSGEFLNVCSIDGNDIMAASKRSWPDFENCLVAICAEKVKADVLVTRNEKDFAQSSVQPIHPDDLIAELEGKGLVCEEIAL